MKNTMTIHRGLAELKTLNDRIYNSYYNFTPFDIKKNGKLTIYNMEEDEFNNAAKEQYQSILDLITRKQKIKSAIIAANATTEVTIAGKQMTIADAIAFREIANTMKLIKDRLLSAKKTVQADLEKRRTNIEADKTRLVEKWVENDGNKSKTVDEELEKFINSYMDANKLELLDPLESDKIIKELDDDSTNFLTEIDATLSEINATTTITI